MRRHLLLLAVALVSTTASLFFAMAGPVWP